MTEITVHLDDAGHPIDVHFDSGKGTPIKAFLLLTAVSVDPPASHVLVFGNSNTVGSLLHTFWRNSVKEHPENAWVIEEVCKSILADATRLRGQEWPGDGVMGNA